MVSTEIRFCELGLDSITKPVPGGSGHMLNNTFSVPTSCELGIGHVRLIAQLTVLLVICLGTCNSVL